MPEKIYELYELNTFLRRVLALNTKEEMKLQAEIAEVSNSNGHVYIDLVDKEGDQIKAKARAIIWSKTLNRLAKKNPNLIDSVLQEGNQVLMDVHVDFHEQYGLKLIVLHLYPEFTYGQHALNREKVAQKLLANGDFEKNSQLPFAIVPQRIAVLSSKQAAGWSDFYHHLRYNDLGFAFKISLFQVALQGQRVKQDILKALKEIEAQRSDFDVVVLIRGGGAKLDLQAFDDYQICKAMANTSLPVLTGIGHETDELLIDRVAFRALKTPTAVADFLLNQCNLYVQELGQWLNRFKLVTKRKLNMAQSDLNLERSMFANKVGLKILDNQALLQQTASLLKIHTKQHLSIHKQQLDLYLEKVKNIDPQSILKQGFTLIKYEGKYIKDPKELKSGDEIEILFEQGTIRSVIK